MICLVSTPHWVIDSLAGIEPIADKLRRDWNLGEDPLYNVVELLEDLKIKVFEIKADLSFSGMSTWVDGKIPVIVILFRAVAEEFISTSKGAVLNNQKLSAFRAELV
jgi:hypothetical protein